MTPVRRAMRTCAVYYITKGGIYKGRRSLDRTERATAENQNFCAVKIRTGLKTQRLCIMFHRKYKKTGNV